MADKGKAIQSFRDLDVYQESYRLALDLFECSTRFPKAEVFSLTDQLRRAARSVPANIAEAWGRRKYPAEFKRFLWIAMGSINETSVWVDFAHDHGYLEEPDHSRFGEMLDSVGRKLSHLIQNWR